MRLSPIRAENHRLTTPRKASNSATPATATPMPMTTPSARVRMPLSMICRSSSGLTTVISASRAVVTMKMASATRYGRA